MVPSSRVALPSFTKTFWPPRVYSPLAMPQARILSLMRHIRSGPKMAKATRMAAGCT